MGFFLFYFFYDICDCSIKAGISFAFFPCCFSQSLARCPGWSEHTGIFSTALKSRPCSQSNYHINGSCHLFLAPCPSKAGTAFTPISQPRDLKRRGRVVCSGHTGAKWRGGLFSAVPTPLVSGQPFVDSLLIYWHGFLVASLLPPLKHNSDILPEATQTPSLFLLVSKGNPDGRA